MLNETSNLEANTDIPDSFTGIWIVYVTSPQANFICILAIGYNSTTEIFIVITKLSTNHHHQLYDR